MDDVNKRMKKFFNSITPIPDDEWEFAAKSIQIRHFKKNEYLLNADTVTDHSFIIIKGLVRFYYLTDTGKEFNRGFAVENNLIGSLGSMIKSLPSRFYIQALEDTDAGLISKPLIEVLYERDQCWERLGRLIAENALIHIEAREGEILASPEARYLRFIKKHPDIAKRLQQYHIASYLHITDVALSRLRKRIKII